MVRNAWMEAAILICCGVIFSIFWAAIVGPKPAAIVFVSWLLFLKFADIVASRNET